MPKMLDRGGPGWKVAYFKEHSSICVPPALQRGQPQLAGCCFTGQRVGDSYRESLVFSTNVSSGLFCVRLCSSRRLCPHRRCFHTQPCSCCIAIQANIWAGHESGLTTRALPPTHNNGTTSSGCMAVIPRGQGEPGMCRIWIV